MVTQENIISEMETILKDNLKVHIEKPLTYETNFVKDGIELDSIMALEFIVELEIKYDIEVDETELRNIVFSTIGNFADFIYQKIQQKDSLNCVAES